MGDPCSRRHAQLTRLRGNLKKKRESLADQFDFKMFMIFHFKDKKKGRAVFEVEQVMTAMTNNYEDTILKGVGEDGYSIERTRELLEKDVVQLHAPRWTPLRKDVIGYTTNVDFFLWPRNDIDNVECCLFSRWKGDESQPFRRIQGEFVFDHLEYEKQLARLLLRKERPGLIMNGAQTLFLFIDQQKLESGGRPAVVFKLVSACLFLPQEALLRWAPGTAQDLLDRLA